MAYSLKLEGRKLMVSLSESIDLSVTNALKEEFEPMMSSDITSVRVDAQGLNYIDSSGVASLLFMRKLCTRFGSSLVFESISDPAARVIQLANLDTVLGLPKAIAPTTQVSAPRSSSVRLDEPSFSDADAMAIFQNDLPTKPSMTDSKVTVASTFEIKPPSFT